MSENQMTDASAGSHQQSTSSNTWTTPEDEQRAYHHFDELSNTSRLRRIGMRSSLGDDEVYHIESGAGSYSTRHLSSYTDETDDVMSQASEPLAQAEHHEHVDYDLALLQLIEDLKRVIRAGKRFKIQRAIADDDQRTCDYTCCVLPEKMVTGGHLYFRIDNGNILASGGIGPSKLTFHICCLEALWQCDDLLYTQPDPSIDNELIRQSPEWRRLQKEATSQRSVRPSDAALGRGSIQGIDWQYVRGTEQRGQPTVPLQPKHADFIRTYTARPPTRFQHLAQFIHLGDNLRPKQVAAIRLWQAASCYQFAAIRYKDVLTERDPTFEIAENTTEDDVRAENPSSLEKKVKLNAINCRSKNLSQVLDLATWS